MALSLNEFQAQKQLQKLVMTPQMQQSIQLLQMTSMELEQLAEMEMMQNPFLEMVEEDDEPDERGVAEEVEGIADAESGDERYESDEDFSSNEERVSPNDAEADSAEPTSSDAKTSESSTDDQTLTTEEPEHFADVDVDWDNYYDGAEGKAYTPPNPDEEDRDFQDYVSQPASLYDSLKWQLGVSALDGLDLKVGEYIIGSIDDDGYMRIPLEEIAAATGADVERVEGVLRVIQSFEPVGVAARDLIECLILQLEAAGEKKLLVYTIVRNHLDALQRKKFKEIAKLLDVDESDVRAVFLRIGQLEPKPGRSRTASEVRYALPDVMVRSVDDGYVVFLNEGRMSGLRLNDYYRQLLTTPDMFTPQEKDFAQEKLRSAVWLLKNIEKRKNTILKVSEAIMDFQKEFLEKGTPGLRPLTLREIAEVVGMHESTVARVTTGKYIDTPRGVFELKYFFSPGLQTDSGEDASSTSIKDMLARMIANEDPSRPLNDQRLSEMLQQEGVTIARRTVAKYREQLRILPAKLRRQVD